MLNLFKAEVHKALPVCGTGFLPPFQGKRLGWRKEAAEVFGHCLQLFSNILNHRPLTIRAATEEQFYAITPADLLLGRATDQPEDTREPDFKEQEEEIFRKLPIQEQVVWEWWLEWTRLCFPSLMPRTKWKRDEQNARIGDTPLLKFSSKFAAPSFRLCRVSGVKEDEEGVVRTCKITMRPQRKGESGRTAYKYKKPSPFKVGVQRLAIILPVKEQEGGTQGCKQQGQREAEEPQEGPVEEPQEGSAEEPQEGPAEEPMEGPAVEQAEVDKEHDSEVHSPEKLQEGAAGERQEDPTEELWEGPKREHTKVDLEHGPGQGRNTSETEGRRHGASDTQCHGK